MLSAHEAKEISKQNTPILAIMKDIEEEIKKVATRGGTEVMYECQDYVNAGTIATIVSQLRNIYGYKVTWSYLYKTFIINW